MRVSKLTLYTKNLAGQKAFYKKTLGLSLANETERSATVSLRNTELTFREKPGATPYHYAINIPSGCIEHAALWLKGRVELLTDEGKEVHDFPSWNAKSIYFYDTDKNIVELISRNNLGYPSEGAFGADSLIEVSEIGLPVRDIRTYYEKLKGATGMELFDGNLEEFSAIGDEFGLFICINRFSKTWYPVGDTAYASDFEITFTEKSRDFNASFGHERLEITRNKGTIH